MTGTQGPEGSEGSVSGFLRQATLVVAILWAAFFAIAFAIGATDADVDLATKVLGLVMIVALGVAPIAIHRRVWADRRRQIRPQALWQVPAYPPFSPLGRLERIAEAASQLRERGAIPEGDHVAIGQRIARLWDLTLADQQSMQLGGSASPVVMQEIERLHARVVGLLDVAIDTAAVAPGDSDLDARLQDHLDRLHSQQRAIGELGTLHTPLTTEAPRPPQAQPGTG